MRETEFINQNKEKWQEFEQTLGQKNPNPKKLSNLFVQIMDDLSYSRTFYPNRSVRVYLNSVAQRVFILIYRNRKSHQSRLLSFWTEEMPQLIYESRQAFRLSFFTFTLAFLIGMLSCAMEPGFANLILGDDYVEMTKRYIDSGDPMAVYKKSGRFDMFLGITINNLYVAFLTFVLGALFILGTIANLVYNAIMVGAFQYFFIERGLFWDSFLTIWIHGTFEISAIIVAGAAGITMGQGLIFPGTYTRMQAFQQSARRGIKIMIGIVPIFVMAGFFEGYLTRQTETPDLIRVLFLLVCLFIILGYFVWFPWIRAKLGFAKAFETDRIVNNQSDSINYQGINTTSDLFEDVFSFLRQHLKVIITNAFVIAVIYCLIVFLFSGIPVLQLFYLESNPLRGFSIIRQFFNSKTNLILPITALLSFSWMTYTIISTMQRDLEPKAKEDFRLGQTIMNFIKAAIGTAALFAIFILSEEYAIFTMPLTVPFCFLWSRAMITEKIGPLKGLARAFQLNSTAFGRGVGLYIVLILLGALFFTISDSAISNLLIKQMEWVIYFEQSIMDQISMVISTLMVFFVALMIFSMLATGFSLIYHTMLEILEAPDLIQQVENIGKKKKLRGLERE